ncbi:MAG: L-rhamnose/proton symporter RhaT [Thermoguttaceae bacterium]|jgi:L-rhamnose-H+ transport protein
MEFAVPILIVIAAGFLLGSFGAGMKHIAPMRWEAWWLIYSLLSLVLFPVAWALLAVPSLWEVLAAAPGDAVAKGMLFGALWGIGGIMFGISITYVGVAITYGVVIGLSAAVGAMVPLLQKPEVVSSPAFPCILLGILVMLGGVVLSVYAGVRRDQQQVAAGKQICGLKTGKDFRLGLVIVAICGAFSSVLNVGYVAAGPLAEKARDFGALPRNSGFAAWVVVLFGGFLINGGYAAFLLTRNRTWHTFRGPGVGKAWSWSMLTGLVWFAAFGLYGQGAALMGEMGPVIGWAIYVGLGLMVGTVWALLGGEWKGAAGPLRIMLAGIAVLVAACCILAYANRLPRGLPSQDAAVLHTQEGAVVWTVAKS